MVENGFIKTAPIMHFDEIQTQIFADSLEEMKKKYLFSQEEFYINSNSFLD